jgi:DNA excision repair protein ERCC-3
MQRKVLSKLLVVKDEHSFLLETYPRGEVQAAIDQNRLSIDDQVPLKKGPDVQIALRTETVGGKPFSVRPYHSRWPPMLCSGIWDLGGDSARLCFLAVRERPW